MEYRGKKNIMIGTVITNAITSSECNWQDKVADEILRLRQRLVEVTAERNRLRTALDNFVICAPFWGIPNPQEREIFKEVYDKARAALRGEKEEEHEH